MTSRPKIRACLFDMDGLLINSEEIYTETTNSILAEHGKPSLPWHIKADLQGRPGPAASAKFLEWSQLPYTPEELFKITSARQESKWKETKPMPGAVALLNRLVEKKIPIALATSSHSKNYFLKTAHLQEMFELFGPHKVTGDDERIPKGRGKPAPDIWLVALKSLNDELLKSGDIDTPIKPEETLVFEDGIPGVEGAKAAGCQVIWVPDPRILEVVDEKKEEIIGTNGEILGSLEEIDYEKYGL
ncbi:HAD-like domain-containing protein [Myxozyma melibiosi]|uniref:HAD-like domain-containing protein n=1 Tax=Myxozyma melibiosi TaxID=54550 RepID=A0ABR1FF82_9ASCO